jgi:ribulose-5-phosphate 4-epimerase/fuculose-1-phosphate aldolase
LLITPTGAHSGNLTPERVVLLDRRDDVIGSGVPSSEREMHTAALGAFPSANAVVGNATARRQTAGDGPPHDRNSS